MASPLSGMDPYLENREYWQGDPDVPLELSKVFATIYDSHYYALRIDYTQPVPAPELRPAMQQWLAEQDWQVR